MITKRQTEVLDFIKKYIASKGFAPSIRDICAGLGLNSPATAFSHVKKLEANNYIKTSNNKSRTIEILVDNEYIEKDDSIVKVPLLGKITAGSPIEAIEKPDEFFDLPASLVPINSEVFTLHVSGESMINRGIYDNDFVIIKKQSIAKNGEIVVAMNDNNEVTLKTFYKESDHFRLQPENDTMSPIILKNVTILGIAVGLYRKI